MSERARGMIAAAEIVEAYHHETRTDIKAGRDFKAGWEMAVVDLSNRIRNAAAQTAADAEPVAYRWRNPKYEGTREWQVVNRTPRAPWDPDAEVEYLYPVSGAEVERLREQLAGDGPVDFALLDRTMGALLGVRYP